MSLLFMSILGVKKAGVIGDPHVTVLNHAFDIISCFLSSFLGP